MRKPHCSAMDSFSSLWRSQFDELKDSEELSKIDLLDHYRPIDVLRSLRKVLSDERSYSLIFDEFDTLADDGVGEDMANLMKAISDEGLQAHVVIVGVAEDVDSILQGHLSVGRNLQQIKMPRLVQSEVEKILNNGFSAIEIVLPAYICSRVVGLSQGLPHYTHLLGRELGRVAILRDSDEVDEDMWLPALESAISSTEQVIVDQYLEAVTTAKPSMFPNLLLACALASRDLEGYFRPTDVLRPLNRLTGKTYAMASFTGNLASMAKESRGNALQARTFSDKRVRYRFSNPLLASFVLMKSVRDGRLSIEEATDPSYAS